MQPVAPPIGSVHECVLYASDLAAAERFYRGVLGLRLISSSDRARGFRVNSSTVLLVFDPVRAATESAAHNVPSHGSTGPGHVAFAVGPGGLESWRHRFESFGVPVELERRWDAGGRSIYVRDSADNSVELTEGPIWPA